MQQFHVKKHEESIEIYVEDANGHHATIEVDQNDFYNELDRMRVSLVRFENIDTSLVKNDPDELLLRKCRGIQMDGQWGLVAELLKRFKSYIDAQKS